MSARDASEVASAPRAAATIHPRLVIGVVVAVKLVQAILLIVVTGGTSLPLVPTVATDVAWQSLLLPAVGLVLVTIRPSFMAWGVCATLFVLSLVSQVGGAGLTPWTLLSVLGSVIGIAALMHTDARQWWRRLV